MITYKKITYAEAINQATKQAMQMDKRVMVMGQHIDYITQVFLEQLLDW